MFEIKKEAPKEQRLDCKSQDVCKYKEEYMSLYGAISNLLCNDIFTTSLTCKYYVHFNFDIPRPRQGERAQ